MVNGFDTLKSSVMALVMVVLVVAALALSLDGFQDAIEDDDPCIDTTIDGTQYSFNTSSLNCYNASNASQVELSGGWNTQYNVSIEGLTGVSNASGYFDTIGTLIGVAALIAVVVGAFYFIRR